MPRRNFTTPKRVAKTALEEAERRIADAFKKRESDLDLGGLGLDHLPDSVRRLTWLEHLGLFDNALTELPDWIGEFPKLRELYLHLNPLRFVTSKIDRLASLEVLLIDRVYVLGVHLSISSVHIPNLTGLRSLRRLYLQGVGLKQVPNWIRRLRRLRTLHLAGNLLLELPEWLGDLSRLETLDVRDNNLQSLPSSIGPTFVYKFTCGR